MQKIFIFLQARLNSSRLKKKILLPFGKDLLIQFIVKKLKKLKKNYPINKLIVLGCFQTIKILKKIIIKDKFIDFFYGSELNVLDRFYKANLKYKPDIIIRATADNPFISLEHVISITNHHINNLSDLSHYLGLPLGTGVEVINSKILSLAWKNANKNYQLEHVTPYFYENPHIFKIEEPIVQKIYNRPDIRLTIDQIEDLKVSCKIIEKHSKNLNLKQIINYWDKEKLYKINSKVKQKIIY